MKMSIASKIGLVGVVMCVTGAALGWGILPSFVKNKIAEIKNLAPGSDGRKVWEKIPFPLSFKVYIFNVTNPDSVTSGAVPVVREIGPYVFEEWREKLDFEEDDENDTVTHSTKSTWIFDREQSWPLTGDEILTVPHPVLLGIILTAEKQEPTSLPLVARAVEGLFDDPSHIFLRTSAMDLMFNGNYVNCTSRDFAVKLICTVIRKAALFPEFEKDLFKFSLFGSRNNTKSKSRVCVSRGTRDVSQVGQVISVDGQTVQKVWAGMPCNRIAGTDGSVFPPFLQKEDIVSFTPEICRSMVAKYAGVSSYKLLPTLHFTSSLGDMTTNPDDKCYCSPTDGCLKKGVMDISKCQGAPLIASLPHFYNAHRDYQRGVHGLKPQEAKHAITADFEPLTGIPVTARTRMQFSMPVRPINHINCTTNLTRVFMPLFWVEQGIDMNDVLMRKIKSQVVNVWQGIDIGKWAVTSGGAALAAIGAGWNYLTTPFTHKLSFA